MSWETRGNNQYYYRKRRQGQRVVSEYVGSSDDRYARAVATIDLAYHMQDRQHRRDLQQTAGLDQEIKELFDLLRHLTYGALLVTGHHTHKGQWRKKRHA